jgi:hypothetical protein
MKNQSKADVIQTLRLDRKKGRDREDGIVNIEAEYLDIVLADLVADFFGIVFAYIFVFQDQLLGLSAGAGIG